MVIESTREHTTLHVTDGNLRNLKLLLRGDAGGYEKDEEDRAALLAAF
jgi:hypothetical protein